MTAINTVTAEEIVAKNIPLFQVRNAMKWHQGMTDRYARRGDSDNASRHADASFALRQALANSYRFDDMGAA